MSATYIVGSEVLPVKKIKKTNRALSIRNIEPGETFELINTNKEIIIHSLVAYFTHDDINRDSIMVKFGGVDYVTLAPVSLQPSSAFLTPSGLIYDGVFEVLSNEPGNRVARLRSPIRTKGFRLTLRNRSDEFAYPLKVNVVYSEVE